MGKHRRASNSKMSSSSYSSSSPATAFHDNNNNASIIKLRENQQVELENLTLKRQPLRTLKFFVLAMIQYLKQLVEYINSNAKWILALLVLLALSGLYLITVEGPHEKHVHELLNYFSYGSWWVGLGVASSIGLGSGLHTFILYLGPHIALFTIKAVQCGRIDLKTAPYDTILLKRKPSWLDKDCLEFGPPVYPQLPDSLVRVPLLSILRQVQMEAILWGAGTALGELPPYFISRAASRSGTKIDPMDKMEGSSGEESTGLLSNHFAKIKHWLLSHAQQFNFFTVLALASVPNPLFDLAGIMCGQLGVPFWEFFLATLVGKSIFKTHIQTIFIISLCNNQLLDFIEKRLILVFSNVPGMSFQVASLNDKLQKVKDNFLTARVASKTKGNKWNFSLSTIWNAIIWLMLINFFTKIVTSTAQDFLKKQQDAEISAITVGSEKAKSQ